MSQAELSRARQSLHRSVPILTYHSLDGTGSVISVHPEVFRSQMRSLREWGFQGIRVTDLLDAWDGKAGLPPRPVVLTFDDGFRNVLEQGAPVLTELGFRATIFAVAGHCGGKNDWPTDPPGIPRLPLLSWSELRDLVGAGFEVGAHTMTHPRLPEIPPEQAEREIVASGESLQQRLGRAVDSFAYPYGLVDRATRAVVAAHYRGACGVEMAEARSTDDWFELRRIDMYYYRKMSLFGLWGTPLGTAYLRLRALGRTCRAALRALGKRVAESAA